jgi:hypothetical protein
MYRYALVEKGDLGSGLATSASDWGRRQARYCFCGPTGWRALLVGKRNIVIRITSRRNSGAAKLEADYAALRQKAANMRKSAADLIRISQGCHSRRHLEAVLDNDG